MTGRKTSSNGRKRNTKQRKRSSPGGEAALLVPDPIEFSESGDETFMRLAIREAERALDHDDVPIGAVVVVDGEVIAAACNERELRKDPTAHAEILALRAASEKLGSWRLHDCTLYVTLEPCPMCAGALVLARVDRLVYGPADPKAGAALSLYNLVQDPRLNHQLQVTPGILAEESAGTLSAFFARKRSDTGRGSAPS